MKKLNLKKMQVKICSILMIKNNLMIPNKIDLIKINNNNKLQNKILIIIKINSNSNNNNNNSSLIKINNNNKVIRMNYNNKEIRMIALKIIKVRLIINKICINNKDIWKISKIQMIINFTNKIINFNRKDNSNNNNNNIKRIIQINLKEINIMIKTVMINNILKIKMIIINFQKN